MPNGVSVWWYLLLPAIVGSAFITWSLWRAVRAVLAATPPGLRGRNLWSELSSKFNMIDDLERRLKTVEAERDALTIANAKQQVQLEMMQNQLTSVMREMNGIRAERHHLRQLAQALQLHATLLERELRTLCASHSINIPYDIEPISELISRMEREFQNRLSQEAYPANAKEL